LYANIDNTKILIFHKGGRLNLNVEWVYNGNNIDVVNTFNYLGIVSFIHTTQTLAGKALGAMSSLFRITKTIQVSVNINFDLFDTYVASILSYGCEVWGVSKSENIDRIHRKLIKWLLNFKPSTNSYALYAEVGGIPLYICRYQRIIKYFLNRFTKKVNNCILNTVTVNQMQRVNNSMDLYKCFFKVRNVLQLSGFACVWLSTESVNVNILYQC